MNRERKTLTMVALTLIALLGFIHPAHAASKAIPMTTIEAYASQIAGQPTTVACDADSSLEGGFVQFDGVIHLDSWVCSALAAPSDPSRNVAYAMLALQHEATHISLDSDDEGLVECTAIQNRWQLVRLFRLPAKLATKIMADEMAIHLAIMPPEYRTSC